VDIYLDLRHYGYSLMIGINDRSNRSSSVPIQAVVNRAIKKTWRPGFTESQY
jgi:hypothetical protein